ncbi:MAG: hypothetical protein ACRDJB_00160 [Actinomycetota bacterium]
MTTAKLVRSALFLLLIAGIMGAAAPSLRGAWVVAAAILWLGLVVIRIGTGAGGLRSRPSEFDEFMSPAKPAGQRPKDLVDIERRFSWGAYSSDEFEVRIRPLLDRLIKARLGTRAEEEMPSELRESLDEMSLTRDEDDTIKTADIAAIVARIEAL